MRGRWYSPCEALEELGQLGGALGIAKDSRGGLAPLAVNLVDHGHVAQGMVDTHLEEVTRFELRVDLQQAVSKVQGLLQPAGLDVVLNHAGDVLNGNLAMKMADKEGIKYKMILTHEDIAPGADAPAEDRRGLVGCCPLYKIVGAAAEAGKSLEEVFAIAERFNNNMATLAVAMTTATHPSSGQAIFNLADDEMEIGMGQHGEAGTGPCKIMTADATAEAMLSRLLPAIKAKQGDELMVLLNGSGATTLMELYILMRGVKKVVDAKGMKLAAPVVGEWLTVQEMAGFQMFVAKLDAELLKYWKAPADSPALTVC